MDSSKPILQTQGDKLHTTILELVLKYAALHVVQPKHFAMVMRKNKNNLPLLNLNDVLATWNKELEEAVPKFAKYSDSETSTKRWLNGILVGGSSIFGVSRCFWVNNSAFLLTLSQIGLHSKDNLPIIVVLKGVRQY